MNRRRVMALALSGAIALALVGPAHSAGLVDDLVAELRSEGFSNIEVSRTMLGRVRIEASGDGATREIVLNPHSGEILRDLRTGSGEARTRAEQVSAKATSKALDDAQDAAEDAADDAEDAADDAADDDDDDDGDNSGSDDGDNSGSDDGDNSGSGGGGNSGSGGGSNSGSGDDDDE